MSASRLAIAEVQVPRHAVAAIPHHHSPHQQHRASNSSTWPELITPRLHYQHCCNFRCLNSLFEVFTGFQCFLPAFDVPSNISGLYFAVAFALLCFASFCTFPHVRLLISVRLRAFGLPLFFLPQVPGALLTPELSRSKDAMQDGYQDLHGQCPLVVQSSVETEYRRRLSYGADGGAPERYAERVQQL